MMDQGRNATPKLSLATLAACAMATCAAAGAEPRAAAPAAVAPAAAPAAPDPVEASRDMIPEVAAVRLREALGRETDAARRAPVAVALAEALVRAGNPREALERLRAVPGTDAVPAGSFWRAQALQALGMCEEALAAYRRADDGGAGFPGPSARLGQARALTALGRSAEALGLLRALEGDPALGARAALFQAEILIDAGRHEEALGVLGRVRCARRAHEKDRAYLTARALLARGDASAAARFEELARDPEGLNERLWAGVHLGWAEALRRAGALDDAERVLETFIGKNRDNADLARAFALLDLVWRDGSTVSRAALEAWARGERGERREWARYHLARIEAREGHPEDALRDLEELARDSAVAPVAQMALVEAGGALVAAGRAKEGIDRYASARAMGGERALLGWIDHALADAAFATGDYAVAAEAYLRSAETSPGLAERAIYNAALALVSGGDYEGFLGQYAIFSARFPESDLRSDMVLERALLQARRGDTGARETLEVFVRDFPESPRRAEAELALAELLFGSRKPDLEGARRWLGRARVGAAALPAPLAERADYLEIWIADAMGAEGREGALALGRRFPEAHPGSALLPEVLMKLGEMYYAAGDYADAETQLGLLARDVAGSPLVERALYLAGECALKSMDAAGLDRAVELFEDVFEMGGALKLAARLKQAQAKGLQGQPGEAVALYDDLLKMAQGGPVRFAALAGKGEALVALAAEDAANRARAVELFEQLASAPGVTPIWRNQALFLAGRTLEAMGETERALATYHRVLEQREDPGLEPEHYWYYRAGFAAAGLLEAGRKWESAVRIYAELADSDGPRAGEARIRLRQLRLQHFLWEE